jgi:hypothetical protein
VVKLRLQVEYPTAVRGETPTAKLVGNRGTAKLQDNTMDLFFCTNTYIALRSAPSHRSEMVSQLLFGERFIIIDSSVTWLKIETLFDTYTGWIDSMHGGFNIWDEDGSGIITGREMVCVKEDGSLLRIFPGSELFGLRDDLSAFTAGGKSYIIKDADVLHLTPDTSVEETAMRFLNTPYLWGGRTPAGIDCSGLVQTVYKIHGVALPRDASQQAESGINVNLFSEARPGDVLFFSGETNNISHAGILTDGGVIIHAQGKVRLDRIDHEGIWREDTGRYSHRLRLIKRVI